MPKTPTGLFNLMGTGVSYKTNYLPTTLNKPFDGVVVHMLDGE